MRRLFCIRSRSSLPKPRDGPKPGGKDACSACADYRIVEKAPGRFPRRRYFSFRAAEKPHGSLQILCSGRQANPDFMSQYRIIRAKGGEINFRRMRIAGFASVLDERQELCKQPTAQRRPSAFARHCAGLPQVGDQPYWLVFCPRSLLPPAPSRRSVSESQTTFILRKHL